MTNLPNPNPDFRIDGPGEYVTRGGKLAIVERHFEGETFAWKGRIFAGDTEDWKDNGRAFSGFTDPNDIIAKAPTAAGEGLPSPITPGYYRTANGKAWVGSIMPEDRRLNGARFFIGVDYQGCYETWDSEGKACENSSNNLIAPWREPVVMHAYVNFYRSQAGSEHLEVFRERSYADENQLGLPRIACIHIRITDNVAEIIPENGDE